MWSLYSKISTPLADRELHADLNDLNQNLT